MTKQVRIKGVVAVCYLLLAATVVAQEASPRLLHNSVMLGVGKAYEYDTYLSPLEYSGYGVKIYGEWMRSVGKPAKRLSVRHTFEARFSNPQNPTGSSAFYAGGLYYNLAYHRRFEPARGLSLLAGGSFAPYVGAIYSNRNGNNPANARLSANLNLSAMAIYRLSLRNYPIHLRGQVDIPALGVFFSPHYGQSYYDIYSRKDYSGLVRFASFHNQRGCRMLFTADFPIGNLTLRAGYAGNFYRTEASSLTAYTVENGFVIGFARDILSYSGKRAKALPRSSSFYLWQE